MIIEYSFENMFSFKEWTIFSMLGSSDTSLEDNYAIIKKEKVLRSTAIYGPNASGKTNLLKVLGVVCNLLKFSASNYDGLLPIVPFAFDEESKKKPSKFQIVFVENEIEYKYGFTADKDNVYEEYLFFNPNGRTRKIFERTNINDYTFAVNQKLLSSLQKSNDNKKFFLSTAAIWGCEEVKPAFDFLVNKIGVLIGGDTAPYSLEKYVSDKSLTKYAIEFLKKADINITDFEVKKIESEGNSFDKEKSYQYFVTAKHLIGNKEYELNMMAESNGTNRLFTLIPIIKDTLDFGKVLIMDEFDSSMHPELTKMIINIFNDNKINKNNAQFIFNTHDTSIMSANILRRDQIWFTDKNPETGISEIYPLDDFSPRKTENIERGYLNGRYGALPYIY